jgi:hypothetical protein
VRCRVRVSVRPARFVRTSAHTGCANPCLQGQPLVDPSSRRPRMCNFNNACPNGFWCHIGAEDITTVCCPNLGTVHWASTEYLCVCVCVFSGGSICQQPMLIGQGNARLQRWYVDGTQGVCGACRVFTYSGMQGNQNNFLTQEECQRSCPGTCSRDRRTHSW